MDLLSRLSATGEVSAAQLAKGFQRVADSLADTALDNPSAPANWQEVLRAAAAAGLVDEDEAAEGGALSGAAPPAVVDPSPRPQSVSGGGMAAAAGAGELREKAVGKGGLVCDSFCETSVVSLFFCWRRQNIKFLPPKHTHTLTHTQQKNSRRRRARLQGRVRQRPQGVL